jgi:hypothetical protein
VPWHVESFPSVLLAEGDKRTTPFDIESTFGARSG